MEYQPEINTQAEAELCQTCGHQQHTLAECSGDRISGPCDCNDWEEDWMNASLGRPALPANLQVASLRESLLVAVKELANPDERCEVVENVLKVYEAAIRKEATAALIKRIQLGNEDSDGWRTRAETAEARVTMLESALDGLGAEFNRVVARALTAELDTSNNAI